MSAMRGLCNLGTQRIRTGRQQASGNAVAGRGSRQYRLSQGGETGAIKSGGEDSREQFTRFADAQRAKKIEVEQPGFLSGIGARGERAERGAGEPPRGALVADARSPAADPMKAILRVAGDDHGAGACDDMHAGTVGARTGLGIGAVMSDHQAAGADSGQFQYPAHAGGVAGCRQ